MATCPECGEQISDEAIACPKCGKPTRTTKSEMGERKITAALLAIFLGSIGIHKFYLGEKGKGILYLVFCWTFIPAILAIIDFIVLLMMSNDDFNAKYNQ